MSSEKPKSCRGDLTQEDTSGTVGIVVFNLQIKRPAFQIRREPRVSKGGFWCCCFLFLGESIVRASTGNLNDRAPEGLFCCYHRQGITRHTLLGKMAFSKDSTRTFSSTPTRRRRVGKPAVQTGETQAARTQLLPYP